MYRRLLSLALLLGLVLTPSVIQADQETAEAAGPRKPIRATFYYPWFGETWHSDDQFTPSLGRYSSDNRRVLSKHFASMRYAGLDAAISSWWGPGTRPDQRFPKVLDAAVKHGMHALPYYEPEYGNDDPSLKELRRHLRYLDRYTSHRGWLRVDGKPVIFVYNAGATGCGDATRWRKATNNFSDYYVSLKLFSGYERCANQPSTWHQYGPAVARSVHLPYSDNVSPGFFHHQESRPRLERNLTRFKRDLAAQVRTGADWQLVTSFSEWGEGTAVESAKEWESASGHGKYLDAMRAAYVGRRAASGKTSIKGVSYTKPAASTEPSSTTTPRTKPTVLRRGATADTFVSADRPRRSYADARTLRADGARKTRSYLSFEVPGRPTKAVLRLWSKRSADRGYRVAATSAGWDERVTHRSAPAAGRFRATSGAVRGGAWTSVDVTAAVRAGSSAFVVAGRRSEHFRFGSSESARPPKLRLTYPSTTAAGPTGGGTSATTVAWAVGDICDDDHEEVDCDDVGDLIAGDKSTDALLALGDLQYEDGTLATFREYYDPKMGAGKGLKSKTYPALGNHEYLTPGAAGYFDYWGARAGDRDKGYYAADLGSWRLLVTNTMCGEAGGCSATSPQGKWLAAELAAAKDRCTVVVAHHPVITDGGYYPGTESGQLLFDLAYDGRADLFLSGHEHNYQRFAPLDKQLRVDRSRGVTPIVVGTGGKNLTPFKSTDRSVYRQTTDDGALRLALKDGGYGFRFVNIDGTVMDSGRGTCR